MIIFLHFSTKENIENHLGSKLQTSDFSEVRRSSFILNYKFVFHRWSRTNDGNKLDNSGAIFRFFEL